MEHGGEFCGPGGCGLVAEVFLDVGEHAEGGGALVTGFEEVELGFPLEFRQGVGDEFIEFWGVGVGLFFLFGIAAPEVCDDAFVDDALGPGGFECG